MIDLGYYFEGHRVAFKRWCLITFIIIVFRYFWWAMPITAIIGGKVYVNMWGFQSHAPFPRTSNINPLNPFTDSTTHYLCHKMFIVNYLREYGHPLWFIPYWLVVLYITILVFSETD